MDRRTLTPVCVWTKPARVFTSSLTLLRQYACLMSRSQPEPPILSPALLTLSMVRVRISARRHSGLGVSGPRRPSNPRGATALASPSHGRTAQQGQHEGLPGGSCSLSQARGRCLLAASHSATVGPLPPMNSTCRRVSILPNSMEMLAALKAYVLSVLKVYYKCFYTDVTKSRS